MKTTDILIAIILTTLCASCRDIVTPGRQIDSMPPVYPDYIGVTVPCNIAPPNFNIDAEGQYVVGLRYGDNSLWLKAEGEYNNIVIPKGKWRKIAKEYTGDSVSVTVYRRDSDGWVAYRPFGIHISPDTIDPTLAYRLLPPLYGTWREIGIYQRDLRSYDEEAIYRNTAYHGNCVNCHSFCARDPERMLLHLRGPGGGTYLRDLDTDYRLDTKTDSTISNFTYPYWHPSGRYVAFSVNDIFQIFHTSDPDRTEVIDDASDVVVYDVKDGRCFSTPQLKAADRLETFPAFSADGKRLFFCSAAKPDSLPERYLDVKYSLCAIDFDPEKATFGEQVDTIFGAMINPTDSVYYPAGSMVMPRPSPDGRFLVSTLGDYGNFMIWHKEADLWLYDLERQTWRPLTEANSDDVESYHSWSSNSRWLVFSSRRDDGLYTRPYIVHIDEQGRVSKPLMLPQRNPKKYYLDQGNSYNIPELVNGHVNLNTRDVVDWIAKPAQKVKY